MGVEYPDSHCSRSPTGTHYCYEVIPHIWRCSYCWVAKWQPRSWQDAQKFSNAIHRVGIQEAYDKVLSRKPEIKKLLMKMEEIRLLRGTVPEDELIEMVAVIMISPIKEEVDNGQGLQEGFYQVPLLRK